MRNILVCSAVAAGLALAGCDASDPTASAPAVAPTPAASGPAGSGAGAMFARVDGNKDGSIDEAEFQTLQKMRFRRLDADGNGTLSGSEMPQRGRRGGGDAAAGIDAEAEADGAVAAAETPRQGRRGGGGAAARLDANGDGAVSEAEFIAARMAMLTRLDADGDGAVSQEEFARVAQNRAGRS